MKSDKVRSEILLQFFLPKKRKELIMNVKKSNKKKQTLVLTLIFTLVAMSANLVSPSVKAAGIGKTFEQQFPNSTTAQAVANQFGKTASSEIDFSDLAVTTLNLSSSNLTDISGIEIFTELESLYISNNQITHLPDEIGTLSKLTALIAGSNALTSLPDSIGNLTNLKTLYLDNNAISSLPVSMGNLNKLTDLILTSNQLTSLPDTLFNAGNLINLNFLSLDFNKITILPDNFGNLSNLTFFNISNNGLTYLPDSFVNLSKLQDATLNNNQIETLPATIGNLSNLKKLTVINNKLTGIPTSIGNLSKLQVLNINNNFIPAIPGEVGALSNLLNLDLSYNLLTEIPDTLNPLTKLIALNVSYNKLTDLPASTGSLSSLRDLDIQSNQLTQMPLSTQNLTSLKHYWLDFNKITSLPETIDSLSGLLILTLEGNQLVKLPDSLVNIPLLEGLYLKNNQLTSLPSTIGQLGNMTYINFENNLLPTDYEIKLNEGGLTLNGAPIVYEPQDQLILSAPQSHVINTQSDLDGITPNPIVSLQSGRPLAPDHQFIFEAYYDINRNIAVLSDYFENNQIKKSGKLYTKARAIGTGLFPNTSDHALTTTPVELIFLGTYDMTFSLNGGSGTAPAKQSIKEGETGTAVNNPSRTGYSFTGWNTVKEGTGTNWIPGTTPMIGSNVTLYAQWQANSYTMHFDPNGGTGTMDNEVYLYNETKPLFKDTYTKPGYTFKGWSTAPNGPVEYADEASYTYLATSNSTLYAQWEVNTYNVHFNPNGGTGTMNNDSYKYNQSKPLTSNAYTREGYVFKGWSTSPTGPVVYLDKGEYTFSGLEDSMLYAQWEKASVTPPVNPVTPTNVQTVKTGDSMPLMTFGLMLLSALAGLVVVLRRKYKKAN